MIKIPYGSVGTFADLVTQGYHYVDRTSYLETLEALNKKHLFFLRPRRFGKSLFVSVLEYYYGLEHQDKFDRLFGNYYIGQNPTPLKNSYLILKFNFSGINTATNETTHKGFLSKVEKAVRELVGIHSDLFGEEALDSLQNLPSPEEALLVLYELLKLKKIDKKLYVLIDEYDQFTNEMVAYRFEEFKKVVGRNGWIRKFYETLKIGADDGLIDRTFITGVTPVTLDSLTSGFNNATDISTDSRFGEMMGFTHEEVKNLLQKIGVEEDKLAAILGDLKKWYNGYLFNKEMQNTIYNSEMVLYFADQYLISNRYPDQLLATSVATDYHKIRSMFRIAHKEQENIDTLEKILKIGEIRAPLTIKFNFEADWKQHNFVSLLFYLGFLTIKGSQLDRLIFGVPNYVIQQLYYQYFSQFTLSRAKLNTYGVDIHEKVFELALYNNYKPIVQLTESVLTELSIHNDRAAFNETHVKSIFVSWFYATGTYHIYSELEVAKKNKNNDKGRIDLLLTRRPPFEEEVPFQFIFELKYLKKREAGQLQTVKQEAIVQLKNYLKDDKVKGLQDLKAYVVVFVVNKAEVIEVKV